MIWLRRIAIALAALAAAALLLSGPGMRLGLWPYQVGLGLLLAAAIAGLAAAVLAMVALCIPGIRKANFPWLLAALVLGAGSASAPLEFLRQARSVPPINDVSTDPATDLKPLMLPGSAESSFSKALTAAEAMGWEIVKSDRKAGRIEAVATTFWFGFKDDVVVSVAPAATGSRIDVRSKSRVGRSDIGANARRIRDYFERLK